MFIRGGGQTDRHRYITRATLAYALFALLWIVVPDQCLSLFTNSSQVQWFATTKDTAFLAISSLLLYLALKHLPAPGFSRLAPEHLVAGQETLQLWPRWASYAFALLVSLSILLVRLSLPEQEQLRPLMTLFVLPIVLSAALGGWGPGILATALAALGVSYYFTAPLHSLLINNRQDQLQLVFLIANGIIVSLLCEYMLRSRGRLKTIQELQAVTLASAGDAIISTDRAGRVVTFNPAAERLTGWSHDQAVGLPLERVFSIDRPAAEGAADIPLSQLLATGAMAPVSREALLHRHNGSDRSIDITAAPIRSSDQAARGVILTCRDVTDRRQAMDILSQSEARYARVIEGSNQGFWEWNLQTDEFSTSAQFDAMLGYAAGETNMPTNQLAKFVHPDDLGQLRASVAAHIQGLSDTHQTELRCLTKGGEWMWILTRGKIVERDQEGRPRLMAGTHTDISARKQTEVALQQAATVFESTREGILIVDASRRIIKINRAFTQLTGYSEAESIGQLALLLNSSRNSDEYRAAIWKKIENSGYWQGELWFRRKNGEIFPVIASINAAKDTAGILANYVSVFMDISTLKASEEQLHFLAHHDALTKLPNRRLLLSQLEHALARLGRDGGDARLADVRPRPFQGR